STSPLPEFACPPRLPSRARDVAECTGTPHEQAVCSARCRALDGNGRERGKRRRDLGEGGGCRRVDATEDRRSSSCASMTIEALLSRGPRTCHRDFLLRKLAPCACAGAFLLPWWVVHVDVTQPRGIRTRKE